MLKRCQILLEDWQVTYLKKKNRGARSFCKNLRIAVCRSILLPRKSVDLLYDDLMFKARQEVE